VHIKLAIHFLDGDAFVVTAIVRTHNQLLPLCIHAHQKLLVGRIEIHAHRVLGPLCHRRQVREMALVPHFHVHWLLGKVHNHRRCCHICRWMFTGSTCLPKHRPRAQNDGVVDDDGPTNLVIRIARRIGAQKIAETESPDNLHNAWEKGE
jgi:hypothetical protein